MSTWFCSSRSRVACVSAVPNATSTITSRVQVTWSSELSHPVVEGARRYLWAGGEPDGRKRQGSHQGNGCQGRRDPQAFCSSPFFLSEHIDTSWCPNIPREI